MAITKTPETLNQAADDCFDEMHADVDQRARTIAVLQYMKYNNLSSDTVRYQLWYDHVREAANIYGFFDDVNVRLGDMTADDAIFLMDAIVERLENLYFPTNRDPDPIKAYDRAMGVV